MILSPHGAELLRGARDRHPDRSAAELLEEALADRYGKEPIPTIWPQRTPEEIRGWLDELACFSDKIPPQPGETFSREMIYQDHER